MTMIRRRAFLAGCLSVCGAGLARADDLGPPATLPVHARTAVAPVTFRVAPTVFRVEPYALAKPNASAGRAEDVDVAVNPGGSSPPSSVPPTARADVRPLAFQVHAIGFKTQATVADVAVRKEGRLLRFTLAADVLFAFDKADLRPEADAALRKFRTQLGPQAARARLRIEGHTDGKGSDAYNDRLALQRALSVAAWLSTAGGLPPSSLSTAGFGKRRPVASNIKPDGSDDQDGRQRNRRVEIVVEL